MKLRSLVVFLFLALLAVAWFGSLSQRALVRPDEGRYAEIPREMVYYKDWVTPRLNAIKYFEKPALQYWATAVGYEVFGESEWSARLWPALTGFAGILLAWYTGRRLWGQREGLLAAAILASTLLYSVMGRVITLDMGLSFFLQLAWSAFIFAQTAAPRPARHWMWLAYAALALAVLSKGIVALVLTGLALVVYSVLQKDRSPWKKLSPLSGLLLFLLIAAPWFVIVSLRNPEFPHFFFIHEHFERFLTKEHHRYQPVYYFVLIYALGALPWVTLMIHAMIRAWRTGTPAAFNAERFLVVWVIGTFVFFSLSNSKLPSYILPIFPALALLAGKHLVALSRRAWLLHLAVLVVLAGVAVWFTPNLSHLADGDYSLDMLTELSRWLSAAAYLWLATLLLSMVLVGVKRPQAGLLVLAAGSFIAGSGVLLGHDALAPFSSAKTLAEQIRAPINPEMPFYSVRDYEQTLPFYIKRPITLVAYQDELEFGLGQEPDKWIPTVAEFKARWLQDNDAFAIMPISEYEHLKAENLPMEVKARNQRSVIVRKPGSH